MFAALLCLSAVSLAGDLYVNGVRADGLRSQDFKGVDITIDSQGDIHVNAPNYVVRTITPAETEAPTSPSGVQGVARGSYWLVTEDHRSSGHSLEVYANGTLVRRIRSGDPQVILDLAPWLEPGKNNITISALPGPLPAGGALHVYIGSGSNQAGVVRLQDPDIDYVRRSSDPASGGMQDYDFTAR